jgi:hypothetical protein
MIDPRTMIDDLRKWTLEAPSMQVREAWTKQIDTLAKSLESQAARIERLRQDVEAAERARDTASLARMRVVGQLNTLHKTLTAATPNFEGERDDDPQHVALRRIEWLVTRGGSDPAAALAAKEAEMDAPMPGQAVLEAVIAGQRHFTKPQLEFSVSEAIVLTGWEMTPVEILAKGEPWLAELILKNHAAPAE